MSTAEKTEDVDLVEVKIAEVVALASGMRMMARASGAGPLELALAGQFITMFYLTKNPEMHERYKVAIERLLHVADASGLTDISAVGELMQGNGVEDDGSIKGVVIGGKFEVGPVEVSEGIQDKVGASIVMQHISAYVRGSWGVLISDEEKAINNRNVLSTGGLIFAIYPIDPKKDDGDDNRIYIVTEPDRSKTRVLLPSEY